MKKIIVLIFIVLLVIFGPVVYSLYKKPQIQSVSNITPEILKTVKIYNKSYDINLTEIDLSKFSIDNNIFFEISKLPKLKKVIIKNQPISPQLQIDLAKNYPNINFDWDITVLDKIVNKDVEKLDLSNSVVKDIDNFKLSLSLLRNLKYIDMSDCNLSNEKLAALRKDLPNIKIVWKIYLGKWSLKTDAVAFSVLIAYFDYRRMTSSDIEVLKYCTDLQALDLGHQSITDISIIGDYLPNLRLLILADNKISDITPISKLKNLHYLELFMNNVKDISPLKSCKELVDLNLAHIPSLYDFSPLLNNDFPLLERLWIENSGGTAKYYNSLKSKYSNVKIVHTGYGSTHSGWRTHPRYYAMIDMFYKRNYISDLFTKYDNMT